MIEEEFEDEETREIEKSLKEGEPVEIRRQPKQKTISVVKGEFEDKQEE